MAEKTNIRKPPLAPQKQIKGKVRTAQDVLRVVGKMQEMKYFDVQLSGGTPVFVGASGGIVNLTNINQGDGDSNRDGDRILPKRLDFTINIFWVANSALFRFILFRWNQNTAATAPGPTDILGGYPGQQNAPLAPYKNDSYRGKLFDVLYDEVVAVDAAHIEKVVSKSFKLPAEMPVQYQTASTDGTGKLFLLVITDDNTGANSVKYNFISRVYFYSN